MKIDLYTKSILTIIALCLIWLCAKDRLDTKSVEAAAVQEVKLVGIEIPDSSHPLHTTTIQSLKARGLTEVVRTTGTSK